MEQAPRGWYLITEDIDGRATLHGIFSSVKSAVIRRAELCSSFTEARLEPIFGNELLLDITPLPGGPIFQCFSSEEEIRETVMEELTSITYARYSRVNGDAWIREIITVNPILKEVVDA